MEMASLEDGRMLSVGHENVHNAKVRDDASRSRSARARKVPAAAPGGGNRCPGLLWILLAVAIIAIISIVVYYEITTAEGKREMDTLASQYSSLTEQKDELKGIVETPGWVYFSNSVYYISATKKTWQASREDCLQKGADLIIIDSKDEQDFLRHLKDNVWIGLSDRETEGTWRWVDGTPLKTSYWAINQPDGSEYREEDCVEVTHHNMERNWNDKPCDESNFWICEMKLVL